MSKVEEGKFVRGPEAESFESHKYFLVRVVNTEILLPKKKVSRLYGADNKEVKNEEKPNISNYGGWHPYLIEIVTAPKPNTYGGVIGNYEAGDIVGMSGSLLVAFERGSINVMLVDGEKLLAVQENDFIGKMNYYRDRIIKGKIIK